MVLDAHENNDWNMVVVVVGVLSSMAQVGLFIDFSSAPLVIKISYSALNGNHPRTTPSSDHQTTGLFNVSMACRKFGSEG